ncbi:sensor histidine kinase [Methylobacterium sp. J-067]|uniref:sensor histidine kinase n=1 Tax=Methylobacterium sp. J-067 TaxID=2836648 RepID=UPI001FBB833C|nr:sensor histidine kinase [Methylobacterium sp. J-067]MCJ2024142.1 histidine kinase [Methylobacterium sp. J-067]
MTERGGTADEAWTLASFSDTIHRGGVALWAWSPVRRLARLDSLCQEFWGTTQTVIGIDELFAKVNLEDRLGMVREWEASATDPQPYSFDFRIGMGPEARWISARGVGGEAGRVGEWLQAIFMDVTEHKRAEEAERLLTAELAHRVSNMFSVARALTSIVAREATSTPAFAEDLARRFGVLHEATTLATRSQKSDQGHVHLKDLAQRILSPYHQGQNIDVAIDEGVVVGSEYTNDYAMIFHELATNSAKYGALSGSGAVRVEGSMTGDTIRLTWREGGADPGAVKGEGTGFGSRLLKQTIERSLRGRFSRTIDGDGLRFEMSVPAG